MGTGARSAVAGYIDLGKWLLDEWGGRASKFATRLDTRTVTANGVVADSADCAALAVQSLALIVNEAFDAAAVLTGKQDRPHIVFSGTFSTGNDPGAVKSVRTLRLAGPLVADLGHDALPVSVVIIEPDALRAGETEFHLEADATGHQAVGYSGTVLVLNEKGDLIEPISVWLTA
jgi:hypothetical protein